MPLTRCNYFIEVGKGYASMNWSVVPSQFPTVVTHPDRLGTHRPFCSKEEFQKEQLNE